MTAEKPKAMNSTSAMLQGAAKHAEKLSMFFDIFVEVEGIHLRARIPGRVKDYNRIVTWEELAVMEWADLRWVMDEMIVILERGPKS